MAQEANDSQHLPTFLTPPLNTVQSDTEKNEHLQIVHKVIQILSDDSIFIRDVNYENNSLVQQPIETSVVNTNQVQRAQNSSEETQIIINKSDNNSLYMCPMCKSFFTNFAAYRKHMVWHRRVKKFKCDQCSVGYNNETNLKIHKAIHSEGKPMCPICDITFQRFASLKSHLMLHQVEELFTCEECEAEFEKESELNKHLQTHSKEVVQGGNSLICTYCNVRFHDSKYYKDHIAHHIKVKKMVLSGKKTRKARAGGKGNFVSCIVCHKSFSKTSLLERHLRVHTGERPFVCEHCNKGFNQKGSLQIHLSKHSGAKPFHCTLCSARFNQKGNLRVHVQKTHTAPLPGVKMYKCTHCMCIFKKIATLNVHVTKYHSASTDLEQNITKVMSQLKDLGQAASVDKGSSVLDAKEETTKSDISYVRLMESLLDGSIRRYLVKQKMDNGVKMYVCSYCDKEFKKPSDLIRHTRTHTKEKPFTCKICGTSFALKSTLYYHTMTHIDNNNYFCGTCQKKYTSVRALNAHVRTHTHKPQSQGDVAPKTKPKPTVELQQPLLVTPEGLLPIAPKPDTPKTAECALCPAKFTKARNLKRHMLVHGEGPRFNCDQCTKSYLTAHALKEHKMCHSMVWNFACKVCGRKFVTLRLLKRHMAVHSTGRPYACPYCRKRFKSVMLCKKHINIHKKETVLLDNSLPDREKPHNLIQLEKAQLPTSQTIQVKDVVSVAEPDSTLIHQATNDFGTILQTLSGQQLYEIPVNNPQSKDVALNNQIQTILISCDDLYTQSTDPVLLNSLNELSGATVTVNSEPQLITDELKDEELIYSQPELNLFFNLDENLPLPDINLNEVPVLNVEPIQVQEDSGKKSLKHSSKAANKQQCNYCWKSFKKNSDLIRHIRTHTGEKPFACDKCDKKFTLKSTLLSHQRTHNPVNPKQFNCVVCNSFFSSKSSLKVHTAIHMGAKTHECPVCGMKFRTAAHRKTHESSCNNARKQKSRVTKLLASVAMDVLESNLQAEQTTAEPFVLLPDSLIQLDDGTVLNIKAVDPATVEAQDFECDVCLKRFAKRDALKRHKRTHVERKFKCSKCHKGFDDETEASLHEKTHEGFRPYSCVYCDNSFTKQSSLTTHMKRIHSISLKVS